MWSNSVQGILLAPAALLNSSACYVAPASETGASEPSTACSFSPADAISLQPGRQAVLPAGRVTWASTLRVRNPPAPGSNCTGTAASGSGLVWAEDVGCGSVAGDSDAAGEMATVGLSGLSRVFAIPPGGSVTLQRLRLTGAVLPTAPYPLPPASFLALSAFQLPASGTQQQPPLTLVDVEVVTPSCVALSLHQDFACRAAPSPNFSVSPGSLTVHRLVTPSASLTNVRLSCSGAAPAPWPCLAEVVSSGPQLHATIRAMQVHAVDFIKQFGSAVAAPVYLYLNASRLPLRDQQPVLQPLVRVEPQQPPEPQRVQQPRPAPGADASGATTGSSPLVQTPPPQQAQQQQQQQQPQQPVQAPAAPITLNQMRVTIAGPPGRRTELDLEGTGGMFIMSPGSQMVLHSLTIRNPPVGPLEFNPYRLLRLPLWTWSLNRRVLGWAIDPALLVRDVTVRDVPPEEVAMYYMDLIETRSDLITLPVATLIPSDLLPCTCIYRNDIFTTLQSPQVMPGHANVSSSGASAASINFDFLSSRSDTTMYVNVTVEPALLPMPPPAPPLPMPTPVPAPPAPRQLYEQQLLQPQQHATGSTADAAARAAMADTSSRDALGSDGAGSSTAQDDDGGDGSIGVPPGSLSHEGWLQLRLRQLQQLVQQSPSGCRTAADPTTSSLLCQLSGGGRLPQPGGDSASSPAAAYAFPWQLHARKMAPYYMVPDVLNFARETIGASPTLALTSSLTVTVGRGVWAGLIAAALGTASAPPPAAGSSGSTSRPSSPAAGTDAPPPQVAGFSSSMPLVRTPAVIVGSPVGQVVLSLNGLTDVVGVDGPLASLVLRQMTLLGLSAAPQRTGGSGSSSNTGSSPSTGTGAPATPAGGAGGSSSSSDGASAEPGAGPGPAPAPAPAADALSEQELDLLAGFVGQIGASRGDQAQQMLNGHRHRRRRQLLLRGSAAPDQPATPMYSLRAPSHAGRLPQRRRTQVSAAGNTTPPAEQPQQAAHYDTQGLPAALANFTSCIWALDFDRASAAAAASGGGSGGDGRDAGLPYVFLDGVTLVVPSPELRLLAWALTARPDELAAAAPGDAGLAAQLAALAAGSRLESPPEGSGVQPPRMMVLRHMRWCGLVGRNVTLTSELPQVQDVIPFMQKYLQQPPALVLPPMIAQDHQQLDGGGVSNASSISGAGDQPEGESGGGDPSKPVVLLPPAAASASPPPPATATGGPPPSSPQPALQGPGAAGAAEAAGSSDSDSSGPGAVAWVVPVAAACAGTAVAAVLAVVAVVMLRRQRRLGGAGLPFTLGKRRHGTYTSTDASLSGMPPAGDHSNSAGLGAGPPSTWHDDAPGGDAGSQVHVAAVAGSAAVGLVHAVVGGAGRVARATGYTGKRPPRHLPRLLQPPHTAAAAAPSSTAEAPAGRHKVHTKGSSSMYNSDGDSSAQVDDMGSSSGCCKPPTITTTSSLGSGATAARATPDSRTTHGLSTDQSVLGAALASVSKSRRQQASSPHLSAAAAAGAGLEVAAPPTEGGAAAAGAAAGGIVDSPGQNSTAGSGARAAAGLMRSLVRSSAGAGGGAGPGSASRGLAAAQPCSIEQHDMMDVGLLLDDGTGAHTGPGVLTGVSVAVVSAATLSPQSEAARSAGAAAADSTGGADSIAYQQQLEDEGSRRHWNHALIGSGSASIGPDALAMAFVDVAAAPAGSSRQPQPGARVGLLGDAAKRPPAVHNRCTAAQASPAASSVRRAASAGRLAALLVTTPHTLTAAAETRCSGAARAASLAEPVAGCVMAAAVASEDGMRQAPCPRSISRSSDSSGSSGVMSDLLMPPVATSGGGSAGGGSSLLLAPLWGFERSAVDARASADHVISAVVAAGESDTAKEGFAVVAVGRAGTAGGGSLPFVPGRRQPSGTTADLADLAAYGAAGAGGSEAPAGRAAAGRHQLQLPYASRNSGIAPALAAMHRDFHSKQESLLDWPSRLAEQPPRSSSLGLARAAIASSSAEYLSQQEPYRHGPDLLPAGAADAAPRASVAGFGVHLLRGPRRQAARYSGCSSKEHSTLQITGGGSSSGMIEELHRAESAERGAGAGAGSGGASAAATGPASTAGSSAKGGSQQAEDRASMLGLTDLSRPTAKHGPVDAGSCQRAIMRDILHPVRDVSAAADYKEPARGALQEPRPQALKTDQVQELLPDGQLVLTGELGRGAQGVVYRGLWRGLDVAVKSTLLQRARGMAAAGRGGGGAAADSDPRIRQAILEAAISASVSHPHVVATYTYMLQQLGEEPPGAAAGKAAGVGSSGGAVEVWKLTLVQELCDGNSLRRCLEQHRLPLATGIASDAALPQPHALPALHAVLGVALHIARGLEHLHSRGIVHGDVSSSNVLLQRERRGGTLAATDAAGGAGGPFPAVAAARPYGFVAKVCDFGLSGRLNADLDETHLSGPARRSSAYSAPELVRHGRSSPAGDVYAFAVVLWELAWGAPLPALLARPEGAAVAAWLAEQATAPPADVRALPPGLLQWPASMPQVIAEMVSACLAEEAAARPDMRHVCNRLPSIYGG